MKQDLKQNLAGALGAFVKRLPWGVQAIWFDAGVAGMGVDQALAHLLPLTATGNLRLAADGALGLIQSELSDGVVLPSYARTGNYASRLAKMLDELFKQVGPFTYLDIGANIGLTTIATARNPDVRCIAFEPEPRNFANLTANVRRNCPNNNVTLHQVAVMDRTATMSFRLSRTNLGDHRVIPFSIAGAPEIVQIQARPLDEFLESIKGPLAVKIDTQGAEPFVISGGGTVLAGASFVTLEFVPFLMERMGGDPKIVLDFLAGFDRLGIGSPEGDDAPVMTSPPAVLSKLQNMVKRRKSNPEDYCDVFAARNASR
jgi:FkbM family methyltransferase